MPTRKSVTQEVNVPAESTPTEGKGAAAKQQPRTTGDGRATASGGQAAAGQKGASKTTAKSTAGKGGAPSAKTGPDLKKDLRDFAAARPHGWEHGDWENLLEDLRARGHNVDDREAVGSTLERERLGLMLEKVPGMGPQRRQALVEQFGSVWNLRHAGVDEITSRAGIPRSLAEKVTESMR